MDVRVGQSSMRFTKTTTLLVLKTLLSLFLVIRVYVFICEETRKKGEDKEVEKFLDKLNVLLSQTRDVCEDDCINLKFWRYVIDFGDIYARGYFPFLLPDDNLAQQCYEAASRCSSEAIRSRALMRLGHWNEVDACDRKGSKRIPSTYGTIILRMCEKVLEKEITKSTDAKTKPREPREVLRLGQGRLISNSDECGGVWNVETNQIGSRNAIQRKKTNNDVMKNAKVNKVNDVNVDVVADTNTTTRARTRTTTNTNDDDVNNINNDVLVLADNQNTHDHGVTSATKLNIKRLREDFEKSNGSYRTGEEVIAEALKLCRGLKEGSPVEVSNAHHVIVSLSTFEYSDTGVTQIEILDLVLQKIDSIVDPLIREGVSVTLLKQLASGVERGKLVCGTGKISRIVSVLEVLSDSDFHHKVKEEEEEEEEEEEDGTENGKFQKFQKCIPMDYVTQEVSHLATRIREDFLSKVGPVGRVAYESVESVPEYSAAMSARLGDEVKKQYVDKLGFSQSIMDPIVQVCSKGF